MRCRSLQRVRVAASPASTPATSERTRVLGYLAAIAISALESAVMVGGLGALGAALYGIGVPKDSVIQYEAAVKGDGFLVMAHGTAEGIARAKATLATENPSAPGVLAGAKTAEPSARLVPAGG